MSKYMVNLVLHDAVRLDQYEAFHEAMKRKGFNRTLTGRKATYALPPTSYWYKGDQSLADVRVLAAEAAGSTGHAFGMVVVKADGWSVMRLKTTGVGGDTGDRDLEPRGKRG